MSTPLYPNPSSWAEYMEHVGTYEGVDVWYHPYDWAVPYYLVWGEHSYQWVPRSAVFDPVTWAEQRVVTYLQAHLLLTS